MIDLNLETKKLSVETAFSDDWADNSGIMNELKNRQDLVQSLLQITEAINMNYSRVQLLDMYEAILKTQIGLDHVVLSILDEQWEEVIRFGVTDEANPLDSEWDELMKVQFNELLTNFPKFKGTFNEVIQVHHKDRPLALALIGFKTSHIEDFYQFDFVFVKAITNLVMVALENKKLAKEAVKQAVLKKEMALAALMQGNLFPEKLPCSPEFEAVAIHRPHQEVGGDYYDCIHLSDHEYLLVIADVSGKGIASALLMSNFQATVHALVRRCPNLKELAQELNASVIQNARGEKFVTTFLARVNLLEHTIHYVNAGHNPPLWCLGNLTVKLEKGTIGLGMFEKLPFIHMGEIKYTAGKMHWLLLYTDGVTDLEDGVGERYETERLEAWAQKNTSRNSPREFIQDLDNELAEFKGEQPYFDDLTMMVCSFM